MLTLRFLANFSMGLIVFAAERLVCSFCLLCIFAYCFIHKNNCNIDHWCVCVCVCVVCFFFFFPPDRGGPLSLYVGVFNRQGPPCLSSAYFSVLYLARVLPHVQKVNVTQISNCRDQVQVCITICHIFFHTFLLFWHPYKYQYILLPFMFTHQLSICMLCCAHRAQYGRRVSASKRLFLLLLHYRQDWRLVKALTIAFPLGLRAGTFFV